jgi:hypothetical protein
MLAPLLFLIVTTSQARPAAPSRDSPSSKAGSASISGRVSEESSGPPLSRALVTLNVAGSSQPMEAITDDQGRYEFTGLAPGDYAIWAGPGELRATHLRQAFGQTRPMDRAALPPAPSITLMPGEIRSNVNFALARALAIEGRVSDSFGEPMADVEVAVLRADGVPYPSHPIRSDDRGEFRLFGLAPGRYRVCATPHNPFPEATVTATSRFVRTCHLASTVEASAADVVLDAEDATGIDIRIQRSGTFSVSGTVVDAAGVLADGADVSANREDHLTSAHTQTHSGRFTLTGLTAGRYRVNASIGGPANPDDRRPPAREQERGEAYIDIDSSDVSDVVVALSKGRSVTGRVSFEGGPPRTPSQMRMMVQMGVPLDPWRFFDEPLSSAVNDNLTFELAGLYRRPLIVMLYGLPDGWVQKSVRVGGRDITGLPTDFGSVSPQDQLEIVATNHAATPTAHVTDDQGQPVTSYQVLLIPPDPARWRSGSVTNMGTPSRDGVMKLGAKLPGEYLAAALSPDDYFLLMRDPARIESLAAVAQRVTLAEGDQTLELRLIRLPATRQ